MPYRWVSHGENPTWVAAILAGIGAFIALVALMGVLLKTQAKFLELHRWQLRDAKEEAFQKLWKYELTTISLIYRSPEPESDAVCERLKRDIDEAEKGHTIFVEDAEVCRDLLNTFRIVRGTHVCYWR